MAIQNNHLMSVLRQMAATYIRVAGAKTDYQDHAIALAIVERTLADGLNTKPELLSLCGPDHLHDLPTPLLAHLGRLFAMRSTLLFELHSAELATQSAHLSAFAITRSLDFTFGDDGLEERRYSANFLHQLLLHPVATASFTTEEAAHLYEQLFEHYAQARLLDRAEDMLFHAIDLRRDPTPTLERGRAFYDALLSEDQQRLENCGLTPEEIKESRAEILALLKQAAPDR